ncbi:MAG: prephenate dehydratase [Methylococcales bacterium]|nr:prephenate dehydratase [Methylococcales bacterium]MBT7410600.1 prephenate dehydratase [Methylococcales bacterium]
MNESQSLESLRNQIDQIDSDVHALINQRATLAQKVATIKKASGEQFSFYRPEREAQVLRAIKSRNNGPLHDEEVARIFREIMSACLALEQPLNVAFLGPEGTFTQQAALKHFGESMVSAPMATIKSVFREVEAESAHYGVVPVENSTEGVISHTLDLFVNSPLKICGEVALRIHHHLLALNKNTNQITKIVSHQQSFAQCREWLSKNYPQIDQITVSSNAEAARIAANDENTAAIAGEVAEQTYGLNRIAGNIEDSPNNTTRFLIIGHQDSDPSGEDKTSLLVATKNKPGALYHLLKPLSDSKISMTRIESRPAKKGNWEYVFFIDINGHEKQAHIAETLGLLQDQASLFKILGSYPCAVL